MKYTLIFAMSILSFFGCNSKPAPYLPVDTLTMRDGSEIKITFFKHASLAIEVGGKHIYIDPVTTSADYTKCPKADLILITHSHSDHFDSVAMDRLSTSTTEIICDRTTAELLKQNNYHTMRPGSVVAARDYVKIEAVAAYNTTKDRQQYHPKDREDCGYILTIGDSRIYIAGDSEPTTEMLTLKNIDIAFLPVNQPYTMTVAQAVEAVSVIRPAIFYPYHYGETEQVTDIELLVREAEKYTEVRVRPME